MGRKIKHYSSGYQIRRKKQRRMISSILFVLLLAVLVFVGYAGAKALSEMRTGRSEIPSTLSSEQLPEVFAALIDCCANPRRKKKRIIVENLFHSQVSIRNHTAVAWPSHGFLT